MKYIPFFTWLFKKINEPKKENRIKEPEIINITVYYTPIEFIKAGEKLMQRKWEERQAKKEEKRFTPEVEELEER